MTRPAWDVLIVGGGPAGLSAALVLGRARRRVIVLDDERPRNRASVAVHGMLSRDGIDPAELRRVSRAQVEAYPTVELRTARAVDAARIADGFELVLAGGERVRGRRVIIATGITDNVPPIEGLEELYGRSVFHCPYCDGWEVRGRSLAVYGRSDEHGPGLAIELKLWSDDVVLCTDGSSAVGEAWRQRLARNDVRIVEAKITRLDGRDGHLRRIVFADGSELARQALFFSNGGRQSSDLAGRLGCALVEGGSYASDSRGRSEVPGVFVVGDASRDVLQVVIAAGEGATAAIALNAELIAEDSP